MKMMGRKRNMSWLLMLGLLILSAVSIIGVNRINAQNRSDLSQLALHIEDLPEDSVLLAEEALDSDDVSHPLSLPAPSLAEVGREALYSYDAAYSFSALSTHHGAVVSSFLYQYPSNAQAEQAAAILTGDLREVGEVLPLEIRSERSIHGSAFSLTGDAGDRVYWFIGVSDKTLHLVVTNGMEDAPVAELFDTVVQTTINK